MRLASLKLKDGPAIEPLVKLAWEKELLGLYVSGHPLDNHREKFEKEQNTIKYQRGLQEGGLAVSGGIISEVKIIITKKNTQMAFLKLFDFTDSIECVVFSETYEKYKNILVADSCIAMKGKISERNGEKSMLAEIIKKVG